MKIYEVSYIGSDDALRNRYFTDKATAEKHYNELQRRAQKKPHINHRAEPVSEIQHLFELEVFDVDISKAGIMSMLKKKFSKM